MALVGIFLRCPPFVSYKYESRVLPVRGSFARTRLYLPTVEVRREVFLRRLAGFAAAAARRFRVRAAFLPASERFIREYPAP